MAERYYLLRSDGTYSDSGCYPARPEDREDGVWVQGFPEDREKYRHRSKLDQLSKIFNAIPSSDAPPEVRAHFALLEAAVKTRGEVEDWEAVRAIITSAKMPGGLALPTRLKVVQQALLSVLD